MRKIKVELSQSSIKKAVKELYEFKEELRFKSSTLAWRLAELGQRIARGTNLGPGDSNFNVRFDISQTGSGTRFKSTLTMTGEDIAFVEFGAGAFYNGQAGTSTSSINDELNLGFTIGSYGLGQGANDTWVYYDAKTGKFTRSHGTKAGLPMTKANEEIRKQVLEIVREVLGDGNNG